MEILKAHECWSYLRSSYIGRLAVINGAGPEIFPVNYVVMGKTLLFRTAPGTKPRALLTSAVAKGIPEPFDENQVSPLIEDANREPWEPGIKEHLICIIPTEISGRRFAVRSRTRWWPPLDFSADWL